MRRFETEEELISEAKIHAYVHFGKNFDSLEDAIQEMPPEFWQLTMLERDQVELRLKKYFIKEES